MALGLGVGLGYRTHAPGGAAPFSPTSITSLRGWYKADGVRWQDAARTVPAVADGDPVWTWDDASGNGFHATVSASANRPTLKLAIKNGLPVLRLDGVDDRMGTVDLLATLGSFTLFYAYDHNAGSSSTRIQGFGGLQQYAGQWDNTGMTTSVGDVNQNPHTGVLRWDGTNYTARQQGAPSTAATSTGSNPTGSTWAPGYSVSCACDYYEEIIYDDALTTPQIVSVETYLMARWGL